MPRYLVTSALPYANGPLHFGHVIGAYLPADVYVRTLRRLGEDVCYVCGADEHGVAITIGAERKGLSYDEYVAHWNREIKSLFDRFGIEFDVWSGTSSSPCHADLSLEFFDRLKTGGYLQQKHEEQLFCENDDKFLPDRYVEGQCPKCQYEKARGDECPRCGAWLDPLMLGNPRCKICDSEPVRRTTAHWYLDLELLRDEHIGAWFEGHEWKSNVRAFIKNQLEDLRARPITRDLKWGVKLPEELAGASGKVLYVWFDAPIGYISFTKEWAESQGNPEAWRDYWCDEDTRLVHFIGKDNIPFHCLVFPSMLYGVKADYVLPWQVPAHEFYNLQGRKFNTSEGWTIPLDTFFERYDRDAVRFYLLSSAPESSDSEWRWEEFQRCVNASLADTIGNLATRVLRFLGKHYGGRIPEITAEQEAEFDQILFEECGTAVDPAESILAFRFRRATEELVANATIGNVFIDRTAPWALRKSDPERAGAALATACEWIAWLAHWMSPFMPAKAELLWQALGQSGQVSETPWPGRPERGSWRRLPKGQALGPLEPPFQKLEDATVAAEVAELEARLGSAGS